MTWATPRRNPGASDARHDFALPMFRVRERRSRRRRTFLRATPTTFGLVGRLLGTAAIVGPVLLVVAAMARVAKDVDGRFDALFFVVVPAAVIFVLMLVPPLWRPGRRYRKARSLPTALSPRGTRSSSSRSAPR